MTSRVTAIRPAYDLADPSTLVLNLDAFKPKEVLAIHDTFRAAMRASHGAYGPLPVQTGWNDITPAIAVELLLRNPPNANRWLNPATVFYYARQMAADDWKPTGQPILISVTGDLKDAQHRLYAGLVSGKTFKSYVVTEIEDIPNLFVYIDNVLHVRGASAALQTAGYNGVSPIIAKVLRLAEEVRLGLHNPTGITKLARFAPGEYLHLIGAYPTAQVASQSSASDWADASKYLGNRKHVVAYVGMQIIDLHDDTVADEFFEDVAEDKDRPADDPVLALRKMVDLSHRQGVALSAQSLAANLILTFNAWHGHTSLGRSWRWNPEADAFPDMVQGEPQAEAAE